jgi:hypothetical protein
MDRSVFMISLLFKGDSPDAVCSPAVTSGEFEQLCSWSSAKRIQVGKSSLKPGLRRKQIAPIAIVAFIDTALFLATA